MKEKILAQLKAKYPGVPKNLLERIATKMVAKVTAEDQIEGAVSELENIPIPITEYAAILQQEGDRRVTEAQRTWQQEQQATGNEEEDPEEPATPAKPVGKPKKIKGGDDPLSKLTTMVATLAETVNNMQRQGTQKTLTEQLHAKLGEKKIPVVFAKGRTVEKPEEIDALVEEIELDHNAYKQELANQGFSQTTKPMGNNQQQSTDKVDPDVINFSKKQNEKVTQTKS